MKHWGLTAITVPTNNSDGAFRELLENRIYDGKSRSQGKDELMDLFFAHFLEPSDLDLKSGYTALMLACEDVSSLHLCEKLVSYGSPLDVVGPDGTALAIAAHKLNVAAVRLLLDAGASGGAAVLLQLAREVAKRNSFEWPAEEQRNIELQRPRMICLGCQGSLCKSV